MSISDRSLILREDDECENPLGRRITLDDMPSDDEFKPILAQMWVGKEDVSGWKPRTYLVRLKGTDRHGFVIDPYKYFEVNALEFEHGVLFLITTSSFI